MVKAVTIKEYLGMKQASSSLLAGYLGVTTSTINNWANGKGEPSVSQAMLLQRFSCYDKYCMTIETLSRDKLELSDKDIAVFRKMIK